MTDTGAMGSEIKESLRDLRQQIDVRFQHVDARFDEIFRDRVDRRFARIDQRFDVVDRYIAWLIGIFVTGFIAVIGILVSTAYR